MSKVSDQTSMIRILRSKTGGLSSSVTDRFEVKVQRKRSPMRGQRSKIEGFTSKVNR